MGSGLLGNSQERIHACTAKTSQTKVVQEEPSQKYRARAFFSPGPVSDVKNAQTNAHQKNYIQRKGEKEVYAPLRKLPSFPPPPQKKKLPRAVRLNRDVKVA